MSEQIMQKNLMALASAFAKLTGWSLATISKKIHGKSDFFEQYGTGNQTTRISHYFTMVDRFRSEWPRNAPWPRTEPIKKLGRKLPPGHVHVQ